MVFGEFEVLGSSGQGQPAAVRRLQNGREMQSADLDEERELYLRCRRPVSQSARTEGTNEHTHTPVNFLFDPEPRTCFKTCFTLRMIFQK